MLCDLLVEATGQMLLSRHDKAALAEWLGIHAAILVEIERIDRKPLGQRLIK